MNDSKIILLQGQRAAKSEAYLRRVRELASQIQQLGAAEGLDTGNVLMDVTYMTVAQEICSHRDES